MDANTRVGKAEIGFNGFMPTLETLIGKWRPESMTTEPAYSTALAKHLRMSLPEDTRVEREYRHAGTTTDVAVLYSGI